MKYLTSVLTEFFKKHPWLVSINLAFSLFIPIQDIVLPHIYGKIISNIEGGKKILPLFVTAVVLMIVIQLSFCVADWHDTLLGPQLQGYIRKSMMNKIFEKLETNNADILVGDMMSRIIKLPDHIVTWFDKVKNYIIPYTITYVIAVAYFMYYDLYLGTGLLVLTGVFFYAVLMAPWRYMKKSIVKDESLNVLHEEIDDVLRNITSVFGKGQNREELDRINRFEKAYIDANMNIMMSAIKTRVITLVILVMFMVVFVIRFTTNKNKRLTTAVFVSMFIMLLYILSSMAVLVDQVREMILDAGILASFEGFFGFKKSEKPPSFRQIPQRDGIYIENLTYKYPKTNKPVIENLTMYIQRGERVAIVGDIGSGKSTLLKILMKFQEQTSGRIYLNGVPYENISLREIRQRIGYIPQQPILFNRSILENIMYGNKGVTRQYIEDIVNKLGIMEEFKNLKDGLDTKVGKNGSNISGGQRQLVWCLRVLLNNPEIIVLDEPTASLDEKTKVLMKRLFDMFMKDKTVVMVTHDKTLMDYATRSVTITK